MVSERAEAWKQDPANRHRVRVDRFTDHPGRAEYRVLFYEDGHWWSRAAWDFQDACATAEQILDARAEQAS